MKKQFLNIFSKKIEIHFILFVEVTNNTVYIVYSAMGATISRDSTAVPAMPIDKLNNNASGIELCDFNANRDANLAELAAAERAATRAKKRYDIFMDTNTTIDCAIEFSKAKVNAAHLAKDAADANPTSTAKAAEATNANILADAASLFALEVSLAGSNLIALLHVNDDALASAQRVYIRIITVECSKLNAVLKLYHLRPWRVRYE